LGSRVQSGSVTTHAATNNGHIKIVLTAFARVQTSHSSVSSRNERRIVIVNNHNRAKGVRGREEQKRTGSDELHGD
jgi:hypothetical protein